MNTKSQQSNLIYLMKQISQGIYSKKYPLLNHQSNHQKNVNNNIKKNQIHSNPYNYSVHFQSLSKEYEPNQFAIQPKSAKDALKSYPNIDSTLSTKKQNYSSQINNQSATSPCIGLINPMHINLKANLKRFTNSSTAHKDKNTDYQKNIKKQVNNKNNFVLNIASDQNYSHPFSSKVLSTQKAQSLQNHKSETLYLRIVSQMNDYFNSMKLGSFKNNRTQTYTSKRNIRTMSQKRSNNNGEQNLNRSKGNYRRYIKKQIQFEQGDDNFNIISLKPKDSGYQKVNRNLFYQKSTEMTEKKQNEQQLNESIEICSSQQFVSSCSNQRNSDLNLCNFQSFIEFKPSNSLIIHNNILSTPIRKIRQIGKYSSCQRQFTQQIKNRKRTVQPRNGFCFGEPTSTKLGQEQIYKLKVLYYKDLIWKNLFNLGLKYMAPTNELKYFVGKGNNSRLIKKIMSKRWWWSLDSKEQSSTFTWTQLKIYSIYEKQENFAGKIKYSMKKNGQDELNPEQDKNKKIPKSLDFSEMLLNGEKKSVWINYISNRQNAEKQKKTTEEKIQFVRKRLLKNVHKQQIIESPKKMTNHLQFSKVIGNKKALYKVMMLYFNKVKKYQLEQVYVPLTFHITAGLQDEQYLKFLSEYYKKNKSNNKTCWIVKPGQITNRGRGIQYCRDLNEIKPIVKKKQTHPNGTLKTFLIQEYIDRPLLYKGRKFDIRHYLMFSSINGRIRGYFYQQGYIRTTSYKYKLNDNSPAIHLTNDAVQKYCKDYGKYEKGNKLSYEQFDRYLQEANQPGQSFYTHILPQIRKISQDISHAAYYFVDPKKKINNFEIFGLDIMIDENFKCYLIEVNTNPCLQLSSNVLQKVIPPMLDNAFALTIDTCYPPPEGLCQYHKKFNYPISPQNKFELVFDEEQDSKVIKEIYERENINMNQISGVGDDDQNYESCDDEDN